MRWSRKQIALRHARARSASAPVSRIEQARGHAGGQLVRIGDAVDAGERVLGEDRVEVEVLRRGVEVRQVVLAPVRRVDVEAGAARASARTARPKQLVSRSSVQALSTLTRRDHARGAAPAVGAAAGRASSDAALNDSLRRQRSSRARRTAARCCRARAARTPVWRVGEVAVVGVGEAVELALEADVEAAAPAARRSARRPAARARTARSMRVVGSAVCSTCQRSARA